MTIVSHKHKFIFIKTRKTAGTSVSAAIASLCSKDDILALSQDVVDTTGIQRRNTAISVSRMSPYLFAKYVYRIAFGATKTLTGKKRVSDALGAPTFRQHMVAAELKKLLGSRIWSNYYKFTIERNPFDRLVSFYTWRAYRFGINCSFEEFALSALGYERKYKFAANGFSNIPFYSLDNSTLCVDKVVRFENLVPDIKNALIEAGIQDLPDFNMPKLKGGIRSGYEYRGFYNDRLLELANRKFALEKRLFGYEF